MVGVSSSRGCVRAQGTRTPRVDPARPDAAGSAQTPSDSRNAGDSTAIVRSATRVASSISCTKFEPGCISHAWMRVLWPACSSSHARPRTIHTRVAHEELDATGHLLIMACPPPRRSISDLWRSSSSQNDDSRAKDRGCRCARASWGWGQEVPVVRRTLLRGSHDGGRRRLHPGAEGCARRSHDELESPKRAEPPLSRCA